MLKCQLKMFFWINQLFSVNFRDKNEKAINGVWCFLWASVKGVCCWIINAPSKHCKKGVTEKLELTWIWLNLCILSPVKLDEWEMWLKNCLLQIKIHRSLLASTWSQCIIIFSSYFYSVSHSLKCLIYQNIFKYDHCVPFSTSSLSILGLRPVRACAIESLRWIIS